MPVAERRTQLAVGVLAAAMAGLAFAAYPLGAIAAMAAFVAVVLVVIAAVDIRSFTIPNRIVLPATAIVLVADMVFIPGRAIEFVLAALLAGVALLIPNLINSSWMGMGDVKLGLLLGAALGWGVLGALEIAFVAVLPFAFAALVCRGSEARSAVLPFGPFMAFGALVVIIVPRLLGLGG
ncbi:MAG: prepilin peptidase [Actinomycetota bacterium]|nr:prepilin peptidase [Actinomycetota bacterium]